MFQGEKNGLNGPQLKKNGLFGFVNSQQINEILPRIERDHLRRLFFIYCIRLVFIVFFLLKNES